MPLPKNIPEHRAGAATPAGENGSPPSVGGILHLPDALRLYPAKNVIVYGRESSPTGHVAAKTRPAVVEVRRLAPGRLRRITAAVESGKLSQPRHTLVEVCKNALQRNAMVVTTDLSRFLRAESYCRRKNRHAWPTDDEFRRLHELTGNVVLATVERPDLSEDQRHSKATRRTGKAGRPPTIDDALAEKIFEAMGWCRWDWMERALQYGTSIRRVAADFGVTPSAVYRKLSAPCHLLPERTWWDWLAARAEALGLDDSAPRPKSARRGWWGKRGRPPKWVRRGCR